MVLDGRRRLLHVEVLGRGRAHAAHHGREAPDGRADRAAEHGRDRPRGEVQAAGAVHPPHADGVQVAADDQRRALPLPGDRLHQPVVLPQPAFLPVALGDGRRQDARLPVEHVGVPLAPLAGAPAEGVRRRVDEVPGIDGAGTVQQPVLDLPVDEDGVRSRQAHRPAHVVEQDLGQVAVAQRAEALREVAPVARPRPRQAGRPPGVGQELGVIELLGGARELKLEPGDREVGDLVGDRVVLPVVVVVLQEEDGRRPEVRAVDRHDLRAGRRLHRGLVARGEHRGREVEVRPPAARTELPRVLALPGVQVPVDVVAVGDRRVRLERQRPAQQAVADGRRQEAAPVADAGVGAAGTAGAGEEEHPHPLGTAVRRRERGQRPRLAQRRAVGARERQLVAPGRFEARGVELPVLPRRVVHAPRHADAAQPQRGRGRQGPVERRLQQQARVADRGQQMAHAPGVPVPRRRRRALLRQQVQRQFPEERGAQGAAAPGEESATVDGPGCAHDLLRGRLTAGIRRNRNARRAPPGRRVRAGGRPAAPASIAPAPAPGCAG